MGALRAERSTRRRVASGTTKNHKKIKKIGKNRRRQKENKKSDNGLIACCAIECLETKKDSDADQKTKNKSDALRAELANKLRVALRQKN